MNADNSSSLAAGRNSSRLACREEEVEEVLDSSRSWIERWVLTRPGPAGLPAVGVMAAPPPDTSLHQARAGVPSFHTHDIYF